MSNHDFQSIPPDVLASLGGGKSTNDQLTTMLTQINSSIKDLATPKPQTDMSQMMMMMMMGGARGGAAQAAPPAAPAAPNVVNVSVVGGGRHRGRKGW